MWDTDMTDQGARMWGELSHDEALRIVQAPTPLDSGVSLLNVVSHLVKERSNQERWRSNNKEMEHACFLKEIVQIVFKI